MTQNEYDTTALREFYMQMSHETVVDMLMGSKEQETFLDYMNMIVYCLLFIEY